VKIVGESVGGIARTWMARPTMAATMNVKRMLCFWVVFNVRGSKTDIPQRVGGHIFSGG